MNEYIYSIVCLSTAVGMVSVLCPEESRQGIKKYVRLIGAVCLLCALHIFLFPADFPPDIALRPFQPPSTSKL